MVQDEPSTQCCVPVCAASSASKAWHSLPRIYWPERKARSAASSTSGFTKHFDRGIFCINFLFTGQFHPLARAGGFQGGVEHFDGVVAGPAVRQGLLPGLDGVDEGAQFGQKRLLRRTFDL